MSSSNRAIIYVVGAIACTTIAAITSLTLWGPTDAAVTSAIGAIVIFVPVIVTGLQTLKVSAEAKAVAVEAVKVAAEGKEVSERNEHMLAVATQQQAYALEQQAQLAAHAARQQAQALEQQSQQLALNTKVTEETQGTVEIIHNLSNSHSDALEAKIGGLEKRLEQALAIINRYIGELQATGQKPVPIEAAGDPPPETPHDR